MLFWSGVFFQILLGHIFLAWHAPLVTCKHHSYNYKSKPAIQLLFKTLLWTVNVLTLFIFCRSDGKDEKSEGEGKDGKGEKCSKMSIFLSNIYIYIF